MCTEIFNKFYVLKWKNGVMNGGLWWEWKSRMQNWQLENKVWSSQDRADEMSQKVDFIFTDIEISN